MNYLKSSYSFEGSDLIASSLLREVHNGVYIDVGANHPALHNNTKIFYDRGWRGLAIDGNEEFCNLWHKDRPRDIFITALISNNVRNVEFNIYPDKTISSIDPSAIGRYSSRFLEDEITTQRKTTTTLSNLLKKHIPNEEVHLMSVDIEGEDLNCLLGAELTNWKPGLIIIETKNLSLYNVKQNIIVDYLTDIGYRLIAKTPLDAFFIFPEKEYFSWVPKSIT